MTQSVLENFVSLATADIDTSTAYKLLTGVVVPRPVAWITSCSASGVVNVAPFSSFNYIAHSPPMLAINITLQDNGAVKDTARNINETGEFVVNIATLDTLDLMNASSAEYAPHASEAEHLDIDLLPGQLVKAPRIALSPVHMECRLSQVVPLGTGVNTLYIGEVVMFHLNNSVYDGRHVDSVAINPIARLGGPFYATLGEILKRPRPSVPK